MLQWFMSKPPTLRYYFYPHKIEAAPIFSILIVFLICFFLCISVNLNTLILAALSLLYFFFFCIAHFMFLSFSFNGEHNWFPVYWSKIKIPRILYNEKCHILTRSIITIFYSLVKKHILTAVYTNIYSHVPLPLVMTNNVYTCSNFYLLC
jgi:hypothetical protein